MEPNETGLSPYYHPQQSLSALTSSPATAPAGATSPVINGLIPDHINASAEPANKASLYPNSVTGDAPTPAVEPIRRKRGRPRKYGTPEEALAARRAAASQQQQHPHSKKKEQPFFGGPSSSAPLSEKSSAFFMGNTGQSFTPHVINVSAGEDVAHKIMLFAQQAKRELCVLSAAGAIKSASLRQQAISGGNVTYDGHFDILTLSGSYVRRDLGGRAGGLSACLCSPDGQIIGGGIGGPLVAAGPVEVILGTFQLEPKKDATAGPKGDTSSTGTLPSPISMSTGAYRPVTEASGRYQVTGEDNDQDIGGGGSYMVSEGLRVLPSRSTDWSGVNYDFSGQTRHGTHESPENGDYD
ncbi:hypothetical protein Dimus_021818 [Dionaea muscipula]